MPYGPSAQIQGYFGKAGVIIDGEEYLLQVNQWFNQNETAPRQVIQFGDGLVLKMLEQAASVPTNGAPTGYPSIFTGSNHGNSTYNPNLPKQVSALTTVPTVLTWDDNGTLQDHDANSYNVSYDVWFSRTEAGDPGAPSGGFLMVWLHDPEDAQPVAAPRYTNIEVANVPGRWDAWIGTHGSGVPIISYVATEPVMELSFDLVDFINDSIDHRATLSRDLYLSNIFAGFEIWRGGQGIAITGFCAIVN